MIYLKTDQTRSSCFRTRLGSLSVFLCSRFCGVQNLLRCTNARWQPRTTGSRGSPGGKEPAKFPGWRLWRDRLDHFHAIDSWAPRLPCALWTDQPSAVVSSGPTGWRKEGKEAQAHEDLGRVRWNKRRNYCLQGFVQTFSYRYFLFFVYLSVHTHTHTHHTHARTSHTHITRVHTKHTYIHTHSHTQPLWNTGTGTR